MPIHCSACDKEVSLSEIEELKPEYKLHGLDYLCPACMKIINKARRDIMFKSTQISNGWFLNWFREFAQKCRNRKAKPCTCGERPAMMRCQDCGPDALDRNNAEQVGAARIWSNSTRPDGAEPAKEVRCKYCNGQGVYGSHSEHDHQRGHCKIVTCPHCKGTGRSDGREHREVSNG